MSTETYVCYKWGYTGFQYYPELPGVDGLVGYPLKGDLPKPYRSRLGFPSYGSGPYFTAFLTEGASIPLTKGLYSCGIGHGQITGGTSDAMITAGSQCMGLAGRALVSGRTDLLVFTHREYLSVKPSGRNYVLTYRIRTWYWPGYVPKTKPTMYPSGCPFNRKSPSIMERDRDYNLARACVSWAEHNLEEFVLKTDKIQTTTVYTTGSSSKYSKILSVDLSPDDSLYYDHLYQATQYVDLGILPNSWAMGLETAYVEACKSLPQAATNAAANILEAASTLANIWHGNFGALLPSNPKDAWLTYRYVYTTTKLDIAELKSVSSRLAALATSNRIAVYGSYTRGNITYRVGFDIDTAQILPKDVSATLQKFGLRINALNVWDMIPYSFVVDWFLPISNIIEYFQDLSACRYEPQDLWWSITTVNDTVTSYSRLPGRKLHTLPYLQLSPTSNKTIFMRIADSVALFT